MKIIIFTTIFMLLVISLAFAQTSIKAEVDKTSITTDELLTYKIIITSHEEKLPAPQVPKFEGFNVVSQAQSSTVTFAKSKIKTILVYAFILSPAAIGKFKIEPACIKIENQAFSSDAFEIEVTQGKAEPKPKEKPPLPKEIPSETQQPKITL
jgi:hypothetical protein